MKRYVIALVVLSVLLFGLFGMISFIFSGKILYPSWYKPGFVDCSENIKTLNPELCDLNPEKNLKLPFENLELDSKYGKISGWLFISPKKSEKVTIFVHGAGGDRREGFSRVPFLLDASYNVILFDAPNHGKSENNGKGVSYGLRESEGFRVVHDYAKKRFKEIFVITNSFGIAAVAFSNRLEDIKAMVIENPPYSLEKLILENKTAENLPSWFVRIVIKITGFRGDFSILEANPGVHAPDFPDIPIIVTHGTLDNTVPFEHGVLFFENLSSKQKRFFKAENATHGMVIQKYPEEYKKNTLELFKNTVK